MFDKVFYYFLVTIYQYAKKWLLSKKKKD